jgi:hypothetical protein
MVLHCIQFILFSFKTDDQYYNLIFQKTGLTWKVYVTYDPVSKYHVVSHFHYSVDTVLQARRSKNLILDEVIGFLDFLNPFSRNMALGLTQPVTEMCICNLSRRKGSQGVRLANSLPCVSWLSRKCGSLDVSQHYGPPQPLRGIALPPFCFSYCLDSTHTSDWICQKLWHLYKWLYHFKASQGNCYKKANWVCHF